MVESSSTRMDKPSEGPGRMSSVVTEMQEAMQLLAGPRRHGETVERAIERAAKTARLSYRTAKAFWYAERLNPRDRDTSRVREAVKQVGGFASEKARRIGDGMGKAAHNDIEELRGRIRDLEKHILELAEGHTGALASVARAIAGEAG